MESLTLAADTLRKIEECISFQAAECVPQARALKMRGGLASLPDEILTSILDYATCDPCPPSSFNTGRSALRVISAAGRLSPHMPAFSTPPYTHSKPLVLHLERNGRGTRLHVMQAPHAAFRRDSYRPRKGGIGHQYRIVRRRCYRLL